MKKKIVGLLFNAILETMTPEIIERLGDVIIDFAEDAVSDSRNKYDDAIIIPLCNMVRSAFDIKDDD